MTYIARGSLLFATLLAFVVFTGCGEAAEDTGADAAGEAVNESMMEPQPEVDPAQKVNLNTGSEEEFLAIPGVGDRMVHEFEEYRPYVSIQQFRQEIGKYVDEEQVAAYEQYVFVPVSPNESDEATLMQLPGVDAAAASALASGRPYSSQDAFLEALAEHVSDDELATAERFLTSP